MRRAPALAALLGALVVAAPAAAETYYGPELDALAKATLDAMRMHLMVLNGQLALDDTPAYAELTIRTSPATFQLDDGTVFDGGLSRYGLGMGFGFGKPTTGFAAFAGVQGDFLLITQFPNAFASVGGFTNAGAAKGVMYLGAAFKGFQVSYGLRLGGALSPVNADGFLTRPESANNGGSGLRPGAPGSVVAEADTGLERPVNFVTLTQAEGASLGGTFSRDVEDAVTRLDALRAEFAPEKLMRRLDLRESLGVPGIGLDRYAAELDYWGDQFQDLQEAGQRAAQGLPPAPVLEPPSTDTVYEVPFFLDDIAGTGVRVKGVVQVSPEPFMRSVEAAYRLQTDRLKAGFRGYAFRRADAHTGAFEGYLAFQPEYFKYFSLWGVPWVTVSYSYNTPDSSTFLPIANAHVLGLQYIYGPPELVRPLVPLMIEHKNTAGSRATTSARRAPRPGAGG